MSDWPSADWVHRCDAELRLRGPAGGPLSIEHTIAVGEASFTYHLDVDALGSRAVVGAAIEPTLGFRQSAATAAAIRAGDLAAGEAILLGRVQVFGDAAILVEHRSLLAELGALMAAVD